MRSQKISPAALFNHTPTISSNMLALAFGRRLLRLISISPYLHSVFNINNQFNIINSTNWFHTHSQFLSTNVTNLKGYPHPPAQWCETRFGQKIDSTVSVNGWYTSWSISRCVSRWFSSIKWVSVRFSFDKTKDYDGILSQNPKIYQNWPKMLKKSKCSPKQRV